MTKTTVFGRYAWIKFALDKSYVHVDFAMDIIYVLQHAMRNQIGAVMERRQREQVSAQFFELFGAVSDDELSNRLQVSTKQIGRLRGAVSVPNSATTEAMQGEIEGVMDYAAMSEQERIDAQELARARREEHQRKIPIDVVRDGITREYPSWMRPAVERYQKGQPDVTIELLVDRLDPENAAEVNEEILPFALNLLASAYHGTGRIVETVETLDRALAATDAGGRFDVLKRAIWSNLAAAHIRRKDYDTAFKCVDEALKLSLGHAPAYYQAIHAAGTMRDAEQLSFWLGRTMQAAQTTMTVEDIEKFIQRAQTDPDLSWVRTNDIWRTFERDMLELMRSMAAQLAGSATQK